jgi:C4-dicarboxylate-specific signal transduction histidine kinase
MLIRVSWRQLTVEEMLSLAYQRKVRIEEVMLLTRTKFVVNCMHGNLLIFRRVADTRARARTHTHTHTQTHTHDAQLFRTNVKREMADIKVSYLARSDL